MTTMMAYGRPSSREPEAVGNTKAYPVGTFSMTPCVSPAGCRRQLLHVSRPGPPRDATFRAVCRHFGKAGGDLTWLKVVVQSRFPAGQDSFSFLVLRVQAGGWVAVYCAPEAGGGPSCSG